MRPVVEENYTYWFPKVRQELSEKLKNEALSDRLLNNYAVILTIHQTLKDYINLPFSYEESFNMVSEIAQVHNQQIAYTDELGQFWNTVETMLEQYMIHEGNNFRIEMLDHIYINIGEKKVERNFATKNETAREILLLKWAGIYQKYPNSAAKHK